MNNGVHTFKPNIHSLFGDKSRELSWYYNSKTIRIESYREIGSDEQRYRCR